MITYALFGQPAAGSLSPAMHNAAFAALGLDARYEAVEVGAGELAAALETAVSRGFGGLNLTVPHKVAGVALCDRLSATARAAGAVNTLVLRGRRVVGYNTDVLALWSAMRRWAARGPGGAGSSFGVDILGAGGAARAAAVAAFLAGADEIRFWARARERAAGTAAELARSVAVLPAARDRAADELFRGGKLEAFGDGGARAEALRPASRRAGGAGGAAGRRVVVQATSAPDGALPVRPDFGPGQLAIELNYRPVETVFLTAARSAGAEVVDGLDVLLGQGVAAFALFTGRRAPAAVMRRALRAGAAGGFAGGGRGE